MADQEKAGDFAGRMVGILNDGMLALMISIGHKTHLFDTMAKLQPSTSKEIAKAAGLNERYVREWLGGMVTGRIVEYDPSAGKYSLPKEHAEFMTRSAGIDNLAIFTQYVGLLALVEDKIVKCFYKGGGVPYSEYPKFQKLQAEETARVFDARLVSDIVPLVSGLDADLKKGIEVLDVGCGTGRAMNLLAKEYPKSNFAGYDISKEGIGLARKEARKMRLKNVRFEAKSATAIKESKKYHLITAFDTIHDQAQPTKVLKGIYNALRDDGTFLMQDIAASSNVHENIENALGPSLYTISTMHCMTVSLAYKGEGLGTVWGRQKAEEKLAETGFGKVHVKQVDGDIFNYYYIAKKKG